MKKIMLLILCVTLCICSVLGLVACDGATDGTGKDNLNDKGNWTVVSPDGMIEADRKSVV